MARSSGDVLTLGNLGYATGHNANVSSTTSINQAAGGSLSAGDEVSINDFGIDVIKLKYYLKKNFLIKKNKLINKKTKRVVKAIIPVHIFGHACSIFEINKLAKVYRLKVIEDAAQALCGSTSGP